MHVRYAYNTIDEESTSNAGFYEILCNHCFWAKIRKMKRNTINLVLKEYVEPHKIDQRRNKIDISWLEFSRCHGHGSMRNRVYIICK